MDWLNRLALWLAEFAVPNANLEYRILQHESYNCLHKAQVRTRFGWRNICTWTNYDVEAIIQRHASGRLPNEVARRVFPRMDEAA